MGEFPCTGAVPGKVWVEPGVDLLAGCDEGCVLHMKSSAVFKAASTGRARSSRRVCSAAKVS
jgi:hypothetical protein